MDSGLRFLGIDYVESQRASRAKGRLRGVRSRCDRGLTDPLYSVNQQLVHFYKVDEHGFTYVILTNMDIRHFISRILGSVLFNRTMSSIYDSHSRLVTNGVSRHQLRLVREFNSREYAQELTSRLGLSNATVTELEGGEVELGLPSGFSIRIGRASIHNDPQTAMSSLSRSSSKRICGVRIDFFQNREPLNLFNPVISGSYTIDQENRNHDIFEIGSKRDQHRMLSLLRRYASEGPSEISTG